MYINHFAKFFCRKKKKKKKEFKQKIALLKELIKITPTLNLLNYFKFKHFSPLQPPLSFSQLNNLGKYKRQ